MKKRLVSLIIASLVISTATPAFAAETTESALVAETEDSGDEAVSDEDDGNDTDDLLSTDESEEEHNWDSSFTVDKEAGCTEAGEESRHCLDEGCGERTDVTEIPALGHDYSAETTEDASCSKEGTITYTCSRCGDSYTECKKNRTCVGFLDKNSGSYCIESRTAEAHLFHMRRDTDTKLRKQTEGNSQSNHQYIETEKGTDNKEAEGQRDAFRRLCKEMEIFQ